MRRALPFGTHSGDREYAERALPQYENAVRGAGGEPVRIELDLTPAQVMKQIEHCDGFCCRAAARTSIRGSMGRSAREDGSRGREARPR